MADTARASDIELVQAYQAGSVAAFDEIFERYQHSVTGLTLRLVHNPVLAEDLAQETFLRVLRAVGRVDDGFNFAAWLYRIATNLCYDELRRQHRAQAGSEGMHLHGAAPAEDPEEVLAALPSEDPSLHPEEALAVSELRREVWDVARRLPDNYRRVLSLRELQGLSYAGIATAMGITESATETLLHRARRRFKAEYLYRDFEAATPEARCDALKGLVAIFPLSGLRRSQQAVIRQHAASCPACSATLIAAAPRDDGSEWLEELD